MCGAGSLAPIDVLAVVAHPDDEVIVGGTLALFAEGGATVLVVFTTSGDAGHDRSGRGLSGEALAREREGEARASLGHLGVEGTPIFLGFPDGGGRDRFTELCDAVAAVFDHHRPGVVLTFGPDGCTRHADHIAAGAAADEAFEATGLSGRLFHVAFTREQADLYGPWAWAYVEDDRVTTRVDISPATQRKIAAVACHRTQFTAGALRWFVDTILPNDTQECFVHAAGTGTAELVEAGGR